MHEKGSEPGQVGIHGDTIDGEAAAVHAGNSLELLNLAPDLVRDSFHEIVRLKITEEAVKRIETRDQRKNKGSADC